MSTYGDLKTEIQRILGNRSDTDTASLIRANFNHVQRILARIHRWEELEAKATPNLVADQQDYTQTELSLERFIKFYSIVLTVTGSRNIFLEYKNPSEWDKDIAPQLITASTGKPFCFTYWGKKFSFFRKPDDAYPLIIRYYQYPTVITDDADTITFENIDEILVFATVGYTWLALEEYELASLWLKRAAEIASSLFTEMRNVFDWTPPLEKGKRVTGDYWKDPFVKEVK